jgi:acyl carrier protein
MIGGSAFPSDTPLRGMARMLADLGIDSFALAEARIDLEQDFDTLSPGEAAERFRTIGNAVAFLRGGSAIED